MDNALELGEFDSYEAYLANLGMSLYLPCLFPCLESFGCFNLLCFQLA